MVAARTTHGSWSAEGVVQLVVAGGRVEDGRWRHDAWGWGRERVTHLVTSGAGVVAGAGLLVDLGRQGGGLLDAALGILGESLLWAFAWTSWTFVQALIRITALGSLVVLRRATVCLGSWGLGRGRLLGFAGRLARALILVAALDSFSFLRSETTLYDTRGRALAFTLPGALMLS